MSTTRKIMPLADDTPAIRERIEVLNSYGKGTSAEKVSEIRAMRYDAWKNARRTSAA